MRRARQKWWQEIVQQQLAVMQRLQQATGRVSVKSADRRMMSGDYQGAPPAASSPSAQPLWWLRPGSMQCSQVTCAGRKQQHSARHMQLQLHAALGTTRTGSQGISAGCRRPQQRCDTQQGTRAAGRLRLWLRKAWTPKTADANPKQKAQAAGRLCTRLARNRQALKTLETLLPG